MRSNCGRTYGFNLEFVKSPSTSTLTSPTTSSLSTTSSETTNSPRSLFTKKPRTLRKRPNQNYNEATILLSAAYPNLFSTKSLKNSEKFIKPITECYNDSSEPLLVFREYDHNDNDAFSFESKRRFEMEPNKLFFGARERKKKKKKNANCEEVDLDLECEELDCESMLDEEIEEGIDSIMGRIRVEDADCGANEERFSQGEFGWLRALRRVHDDSKWLNFLVVDMLQISPRMKNATTENLVPTTVKKKRKKKKKVVKKLSEEGLSKGLLLKLNYNDVRNAWSDRGSPFTDGLPGNDVAPRFSSFAGDLKSKRKKV